MAQIIITFSLSSTWTSSWVYKHRKYALNCVLGIFFLIRAVLLFSLFCLYYIPSHGVVIDKSIIWDINDYVIPLLLQEEMVILLIIIMICAKLVSGRRVAVTWSILEMSQGRAPLWASSTIFCLVESGSGLPLTNTPPSWFTPLWPAWRPKHRSHPITPHQRAGTIAWRWSNTEHEGNRNLFLKLFSDSVLLPVRLNRRAQKDCFWSKALEIKIPQNSSWHMQNKNQITTASHEQRFQNQNISKCFLIVVCFITKWY